MSLIEQIHARCEEEGDCLLWRGSVSTTGKLPVMYLPGVSGMRHVRPILYRELRGEVPEGRCVSTTCGNRLCLNPLHLNALTHKRAKQMAAKRGAYGKPAQIRKGAATRRARSWITEEVIEMVKAAATCTEAHELTGVSLSHAKNIRAGRARVDFANPFAGLGA